MLDHTRDIRQETLPSGLVVITEAMANVRSVSIGVWVRTGSRREPKELNGISHFLEHMVFKGTERRSAEEIARAVDRVGGLLDAFTSKELVCFNTRVLDEHMPVAFDVLTDLVLHPRFDPEDIKHEQSVVLEEIKMVQDVPDDLVHEVFAQSFWGDHPLGRPILGTAETVPQFDRTRVFDWFQRWYRPNNLVLTAAGNLEHAQIVELAAAAFSRLDPADNGDARPAPEPHAGITYRNRKEIEQVHVCIGVPAYRMADPRRHVVSVLNNILGAGMSSRLFQNIREKQGLAYSVFSELMPYHDTGVLSVYAGTAVDTADRLVRSVVAEFRSLAEEAVSDEELTRAKDNLKGVLLLSLETTSARMSHLARQHLYYDRIVPTEEILASVDSVSHKDVQDAARDFFAPDKICVTALGPLDGVDLSPQLLTP